MRHLWRLCSIATISERLSRNWRNCQTRRGWAKLVATVCVTCSVTFAIAAFAGLLSSPLFYPEPLLLPAEALAIASEHPLPDKATWSTATPRVTKNIHFMYKEYTMDVMLRSFLSSWREVHPDYKLYFWTDREINELVRLRYPTWQELYHRQLSNYLERSDTARAFILDALGGWYVDIDTKSLRRADQMVAKHAMVLPLEPYIHSVWSFKKPRMVSNAIMYSVPRHPFWMYYLQKLKDSLVGKQPRTSTLDAAIVTGPVLLTDAALLFIQAHSGNGCPGPWCPYLPQPVQFMPIYDDSSPKMQMMLRDLCTRSPFSREITEDCKRYRRQNYRSNLDLSQSFAYHAFLHLNERDRASYDTADVRDWGLNLTVGDVILRELRLL